MKEEKCNNCKKEYCKNCGSTNIVYRMFEEPPNLLVEKKKCLDCDYREDSK